MTILTQIFIITKAQERCHILSNGHRMCFIVFYTLAYIIHHLQSNKYICTITPEFCYSKEINESKNQIII